MCAVVDGEVECVHTGAAVGIGVFVGVCVRGIVSIAVPLELLANGGVNHIVCAVVDGEVKCHHAVSSVNIGEVLYIISADGIYRVIPLVRFASHFRKFA